MHYVPGSRLYQLVLYCHLVTALSTHTSAFSLPCERHQRRVERDGQQKVRRAHRRHGQDGGEAEAREDDAELEVLEHLGHLEEEVGELDLLGRRAPRHVDLEHVRKERLRDVQRQAAEEDGEHGGPLEILDHCETGKC